MLLKLSRGLIYFGCFVIKLKIDIKSLGIDTYLCMAVWFLWRVDGGVSRGIMNLWRVEYFQEETWCYEEVLVLSQHCVHALT